MGSLGFVPQTDPHAVEADGKPFNDSSTQPKVGDSPEIHYFAPPHCTKLRDVLIVIFYHMLPFTMLPNVGLCYLAYYLYREYSVLAMSGYLGFLGLLVALPPYYSKSVRRNVRGLYEALASYLPSAQYIVPKNPLPEGKAYIFALHPHGRMFYANAMFSQLHEIWRAPLKLMTGDLFQTAAGGFFQVPLVRNWFYIIGIIPVDKHIIVEKLRNKDHVTIAVGGVKEVCLGTQDDADLIYLQRRKWQLVTAVYDEGAAPILCEQQSQGYIRHSEITRRGFLQIAMDEGAGVVPVYAFNENQLFKHDPKAVLNFWAWVNRYVKVGVPFMRGYFHLPMPYRKDLLLVFGDPLLAKEGETIEEFHDRYIETLKQLFHKYVGLSPDPNHKLIIK